MRKWMLPSFLFLVLLLLLISPQRYFSSVQGGVLLFASSVLPSMLPYFFFTKLLTGTGPPLTSINTHQQRTGARAVQLLISGEEKHETADWELVERGSCARVKP